MVKSNRHLFLSQKMWHTFKGMAWSHMSRLTSKHVKQGRKEVADSLGLDYDVKDMYHMVRMVLEVNQLLRECDLDLTANSDLLLDVRNGKWSLNEAVNFFNDMMAMNESLLNTTDLPYQPDEKRVHDLLVECLNLSWGDEVLTSMAFNVLR